MTSSYEVKSIALNYVRHVQTKLTGDGRQTYDQFSHILKQFRLGKIHSSIVVSTVQKLFHNHPDLLHAFKTFVSSNHSSAAGNSDLSACLDFLNRVGARFYKSGVYRKFLDCMNSYSRGESSVSEVSDQIAKLLGKHQDLIAEFRSFISESCIQERIKKRKTDFNDHDDQEFSLQHLRKKTNPNPTTLLIDQENAVARRTSSRRRTANSLYGQEQEEEEEEEEEEVAASPPRKQQRIISINEKIDFDMEESLFEVDVQIGKLTSTYMNAVKLMRRLSGGLLSPADVRLEEHFTPLNLACIRSLDRKLLDNDENPGSAMPELMKILVKKKEALEKSRIKITQKWIKIRQSRF